MKDYDFGNKQAPIGDDDLASSVTLTGQAVIKQSHELIKKYIKEKIPNIPSTELNQAVIYSDTDSAYITISPFVKYLNLIFETNNIISDDAHTLIKDLESYLNIEINKWGKKALNSKDCRFIFKRESICKIGIFLQKKRYVLHVLDDEGIQCNKFKYTGVEVVRTTMPVAIKPYAKKIIETMLTTKSMIETNNVIAECYDIFKNQSLSDIAFVMGVKGYEKYAPQCKEFEVVKRMPIHVKSAYYHNLILKKLDIENKYEIINSGDKVRYVYLEKPNKYGIDTIGFKYIYPTEFESIFKPDYNTMFNKVLFSMVERFYDNLNWTARKPSESVQTELFDLFG